MPDIVIWLTVAVSVAAAGLWTWHRWHPISFWYLIGFPLRALAVYGTWRSVASGCGLARRCRRWRWTIPGFRGFPHLGD